MNEKQDEIMLDLLFNKAVYGLSDVEEKQLEALGIDETEIRSFELTAASISMIGVESHQELPDHLRAKITAAGEAYFKSGPSSDRVFEPSASIIAPGNLITESVQRGSMWNWLGWAVAAAASVLLAVNIYTNGVPREVSRVDQPTPAPVRELSSQEKRQSLLSEPANLFRASLTAGNVKELTGIAGDIVWSDAKQDGYVRVQGLPVNDPLKETYQLWIFDENQDPKTPIDGGTFNIETAGEVIVPIDARLKARNPKQFAVTIEKPGGVVVSKQERVAAVAKRET